MRRIGEICPTEHTMEIFFPDSRFETPARVVVVIVDDHIRNSCEDYRAVVDSLMGPTTGWDRQKHSTKFQSYMSRLNQIRDRLIAAKDADHTCVIVPILVPGWDGHLRRLRQSHGCPEATRQSRRLPTWWQEDIVDVKEYPLVIELLYDEDSWLVTIQDELVPKLNKNLAKWQGAKPQISETICCPMCLIKDGRNSPFCFDRVLCNKQIKTPEGAGYAHDQRQQCPRCKHARREPDILEVVKPQVYKSHCADSQEAVLPPRAWLRQFIIVSIPI